MRRWLRRLEGAASVVIWLSFAAGFFVVGTVAAVLFGAGWAAPVWGLLVMAVLLVVLWRWPANDPWGLSDVNDRSPGEG